MKKNTNSSDRSLSNQNSGPLGSTARMLALGRSYLTGRSLPQLENKDIDEKGYTIPSSILVNSYPASLAQLYNKLQYKYLIENISYISFALTIDINYLDTRFPKKNSPPTRCLLINRNHVAREFGGARDFFFFSLVFHLAYGNFSSTHAPAFLTNHVLAVIKNNISFRNSGTNPLSCEYF